MKNPLWPTSEHCQTAARIHAIWNTCSWNSSPYFMPPCTLCSLIPASVGPFHSVSLSPRSPSPSYSLLQLSLCSINPKVFHMTVPSYLWALKYYTDRSKGMCSVVFCLFTLSSLVSTSLSVLALFSSTVDGQWGTWPLAAPGLHYHSLWCKRKDIAYLSWYVLFNPMEGLWLALPWSHALLLD